VQVGGDVDLARGTAAAGDVALSFCLAVLEVEVGTVVVSLTVHTLVLGLLGSSSHPIVKLSTKPHYISMASNSKNTDKENIITHSQPLLVLPVFNPPPLPNPLLLSPLSLKPLPPHVLSRNIQLTP
jgi:hypothetical protein